MIELVMPEEAIIMMTAVAHGYEGLRGLGRTGLYYPYQASGDSKEKQTIGRGHLIKAREKEIGISIGAKLKNPYDGLTLQEVNDLFTQDVRVRANGVYTRISKWRKPTSAQAAAWLDIDFNCPSAEAGITTDIKSDDSTPVKYWIAGDMLSVAAGFMLYTKSSGEHRRGLFRRRGTEALMLLTGNIHIAKTDATQVQLEVLLKKAGVLQRAKELGFKRRPEFQMAA